MVIEEPAVENFDMPRRLLAEGLGTGLLATTVIGSGIMAQSLTPDTALALLANTLATGAILVVLITIFAPISGAHFNPVVSLVFYLRGDLPGRDAAFYIGMQVAGGIFGTATAHLMFGLPLLQISPHIRNGSGQLFAEFIATSGLVITILAGIRFEVKSVPWLVGMYVVAAYWFTASTAFANPAVAIARSLTNSFAGIRPVDLPGFMTAELFGGLSGLALMNWLLTAPRGKLTAMKTEAKL